MALFQDFSFSKPASRRSNYEEVAPLEDLRGSRSPSPFSSSSPARKLSLAESLPSLTDTTSTYSSAPISARLLGADRRRGSLAREYFETIRARRQGAVRAQCDPRRASAIRLYVENLLSEESNGLELHPSSHCMEFPLPKRSAPPTSCCEEMSRTSTEDEEDEIEAMKALSITERSSGPRASSGISRQRHAIQKKPSKIKTKTRVVRC